MSSKKVKTKNTKTVAVEAPPPLPAFSDWPLIVFFSALAAFFTFAFVFSTMVPYFQMTTYLEDIRTGRVQKILKTDFIFSPYTYAQRVIRYEFLKYLEEQNLGAGDMPLLDGAIHKMEESVAIEGSSPYQYIRLGRAMERKVEVLRDPVYFQSADDYYKKAISLSPKRQETAYAYGLSLIRQGKDKADEAVLVLMRGLDKDIPISYYYLGLAEFNLGKKTYVSSLGHLEFYFEKSHENPDPNASQDVYQKLFHFFYNAQDTIRVQTAAARLDTFHSDPEGQYLKVVDFIKKNNQLPPLQFNGFKLSSAGGM